MVIMAMVMAMVMVMAMAMDMVTDMVMGRPMGEIILTKRKRKRKSHCGEESEEEFWEARKNKENQYQA